MSGIQNGIPKKVILKNKKVLITGGSQGIGKALVNVFFEHGAIVTYTYKKNSRSLIQNTKVNKIRTNFCSKIKYYKFLNNLSTRSDFDILINNAGIYLGQPIQNTTMKNWLTILKVNLTAPFEIIQRVLPAMKKRRSGKIINIGSIAALVSKPNSASYAATKGGIVAMTRAMAIELAPFNILVNSVSPGPTQTSMTNKHLDLKTRKKLCDQIPCKRLANPEEIAYAVAFLASDENTYITGQNIIVDGGAVIV